MNESKKTIARNARENARMPYAGGIQEMRVIVQWALIVPLYTYETAHTAGMTMMLSKKCPSSGIFTGPFAPREKVISRPRLRLPQRERRKREP